MVSPIKHRLKPLIILILAVSCQLSAVSCFAQSSQYIRVAIIQDAESLSLKIRGAYEIADPLTKEVLFRGKNLWTTVKSYKDGILMGGENFNTSKIFIKVKDSEAVAINNRIFRGNIELIKKDNLHLLAVNHIDLEEYIKGILYHESSHYWPQEILKAQAVVCRTYAAYQIKENKPKNYDVTSDIYSQVYGGRYSERYRTNRIVEATRDEVLTYQDKIFPTYYHATCGAHTEDASLLWNIDIKPLKGVVCNFCKDSPHFKWHLVIAQDELKDKLVDAGYKIANIKDIVIVGRDKSGRITDLKIVTGKKDIRISSKEFRNTMGPNMIKSTNFNVRIVNHDIVFEGYGWGHGVGLCQWGGYFMAKQGRSYKEILSFYYPASKISLIANR